MEITVYVHARDAERLAVLLKAVNAANVTAIGVDARPWTLEDLAMITLSRGIFGMEETYARFIPEASA